MGLTRRQRRDLTALGQQLAREDPDLAALLSQPAESASRRRRRHAHAGVLIGQVLFVLGLLMITWGALMSTPTATTVGAIVLLTCFVPWQYGSTANRH